MKIEWRLLRNPVHLLSFGFGTGLSPFAPGTVGTLLAMLIYWLIKELSIFEYSILLVIVTLASIWICGVSARLLDRHDDPRIVLDEVVGYLVTMMLAPTGFIWMLAGFILFRFFDIVKPWPIRNIDRRVKGGLGIVLDDIIAGLFALFILYLATWSVKWVG